MSSDSKTIRIFMLPLQYPCGPDSACCGPVGQSEEEIQNLQSAIQNAFHNEKVEVISVIDGSQMKNNLPVVRLVHSLGVNALPIISLNNEVVCMGTSNPDQVVSVLREKIGQISEV